jgi:hypothetical protein
MSHITIEQLEELREAESISRLDFNGLLEDYTGIKAIPYTAFYYEDIAGNWVGDSDSYDVDDILRNAYIEVRKERPK